jgi:hypothetical protein
MTAHVQKAKRDPSLRSGWRAKPRAKAKSYRRDAEGAENGYSRGKGNGKEPAGRRRY